MLLRKGRPQGPQAWPQVRPAPTIHLVGLHWWDWTWGAGRVGRGAGLLREGGGQRAIRPSPIRKLVKNPHRIIKPQ